MSKHQGMIRELEKYFFFLIFFSFLFFFLTLFEIQTFRTIGGEETVVKGARHRHCSKESHKPKAKVPGQGPGAEGEECLQPMEVKQNLLSFFFPAWISDDSFQLISPRFPTKLQKNPVINQKEKQREQQTDVPMEFLQLSADG